MTASRPRSRVTGRSLPRVRKCGQYLSRLFSSPCPLTYLFRSSFSFSTPQWQRKATREITPRPLARRSSPFSPSLGARASSSGAPPQLRAGNRGTGRGRGAPPPRTQSCGRPRVPSCATSADLKGARAPAAEDGEGGGAVPAYGLSGGGGLGANGRGTRDG